VEPWTFAPVSSVLDSKEIVLDSLPLFGAILSRHLCETLVSCWHLNCNPEPIPARITHTQSDSIRGIVVCSSCQTRTPRQNCLRFDVELHNELLLEAGLP
jgi:hypothetical protein